MSARRLFIALTLPFAAVVACAAVAYLAGVRYNTTPSMPRGLWRLVPGAPARGDCVFFRPDITNPVVQWGRGVGVLPWSFHASPLMLKRIVAGPGDRIDITDQVAVNGAARPLGGVLVTDGVGRPIPRVSRSGVLSPGSWWLMGDTGNSFDSRYFGPVEDSQIIGRAVPLWLW